MHDDVRLLALDVTDLEEDRRLVGANDHDEPAAEVSYANGIAVCVQDLLFTQPVLQRRRGDDRAQHAHKITWTAA